MTTTPSKGDASPSPATQSSTAAATAPYGALAGTLVMTAYAALEMLVSGPFNLQPDESVGSWYIGALFPYLLIYAGLGALTGLVVGFVLARTGRQRHHVLPTLSAILMVAFVVNAWFFGFPLGGSVFLVFLLPLALWLLAGLLFPKENPARSFVGSPWPAALMTLPPLALSRGDLIGMATTLNIAAASLLIAMVLGLALLARSRVFPSRLASWKPQAAVTGAVFLLSFGLLWLLSTEPVAALQRATPADRPNIVLITLDTTRADRMSVYGHPHRTTPRLEAFASRATLYRHAYANGDMTLSSHGSLFTGLYPTLHGAHIDRAQRWAIAATVPTLGELLRKAGYRNYASVANPVYLDPIYGFARGFDEWRMPRPLAVLSPVQSATYLLRVGVYKLALPWLWTEALRQFVPASVVASAGETLITEADGQPFFLFLNFMESHRPWMSSGEFRTLFPGYEQTFDDMAVRSLFPEVMAGRRAVTALERAKLGAAYDGSLAYLDDVVGGLLERFAAEPWYDKSLIIVTADHGDQLGEKNQLDHADGVDHGVTSIPMIVKFPGQTTGRDVRSPVSLVDVFSTIAAAAGAAVPGARAGLDLGAGDPGEERILIMESFPDLGYILTNPKMNRMERAVVRGRWKLISSSRGRRELYDMVSDPTESTELSASRADVARELDGLLQAWAASAERQKPATNVPAQDRNLLQRMRALGYVQ